MVKVVFSRLIELSALEIALALQVAAVQLVVLLHCAEAEQHANSSTVIASSFIGNKPTAADWPRPQS